MFLGVSVRLFGVEDMTDQDRRELGHVVARRRLAEYGTKLAAYQAAKVNAATWDRIESGQRVKDHTLAQVVQTLWHGSGGDWRYALRVGADFASAYRPGDPDHEEYLAGRVQELQERIERLELLVFGEDEIGPEGYPVPTTKREEVGSDDRSAATSEADETSADDQPDLDATAVEDEMSDLDGYVLAARDVDDDEESEAQQEQP